MTKKNKSLGISIPSQDSSDCQLMYLFQRYLSQNAFFSPFPPQDVILLSQDILFICLCICRCSEPHVLFSKRAARAVFHLVGYVPCKTTPTYLHSFVSFIVFLYSSVMVGEGANLWAKIHDVTTCSHDDLITGVLNTVGTSLIWAAWDQMVPMT